MLLQVLAQGSVIGQRTERCHNLEVSLRQLWERCSGQVRRVEACPGGLSAGACRALAACSCHRPAEVHTPLTGTLEEVGTEVRQHLSKASDVVNAATACQALQDSFTACWQALAVELPFPGEAR